MQNHQQIALQLTPASPCPERSPNSLPLSLSLSPDSSPNKRKQCTQMCLQMGRGLSSEEKNCLLTCYQRGTFPIRKILSL